MSDVLVDLEYEWEALGLLSFHGSAADIWYADLTREDVESIRSLIQRAASEIWNLRRTEARA